MYDLIVVGGGPAGVTAALRARELDASVALVERGRMGGTCTNDGCAPTRVLAKAARLVRDAEHFDEYGLLGQAPTVDLRELLSRTQERVYRLHEKKQLLEHLEQAGVTTLTQAGTAHFVDSHTLQLGDGRQIKGHKFILCVGGHARKIPFPGSDHTLTHSDVWTMQSVPSSLAIVGGAATGCQLASIFSAFGSDVAVLDILPHLLGAEDPDVAEALGKAFGERGMRVLAGIDGVDRVETDQTDGGRILHLHYRSDGVAQTLPVEAIIMAIGWVGNVEELNLEVAGVAHERGYVQVDETLRTTAPHIFAAGDITGRMMLVQSAAHDARVAAENAILGNSRSFHHYIVPHGGFTDPEYGSVGLTEPEARADADCAVAVVPYTDLDRAVIDRRLEGFCKLIVSRESGQILGAHVVGEQALEIVQIAAAGMAAGMTVDVLADLELAYPTYSAIIGLAARQLVRELDLTPLAPEWRTLRRLKERTAEWERATTEP